MASVTTPTYSPSLHDALPIFLQPGGRLPQVAGLAAAVEPFVGDEQGAGWHREGKISRSLPWMPLLCHPEQMERRFEPPLEGALVEAGSLHARGLSAFRREAVHLKTGF